MRRLAVALGGWVLLAEAAAGVPQERRPEAAAPQDRVDLAGVLDSWYKIEQADRHVGFLHEYLERVPAGNPWRYNYHVDAEIEVMVPDPQEPGKEVPLVESVRVRARLDDTYAPVDWQQRTHSNGVDVDLLGTVDENGQRSIEVVFSAADRRQFPVPQEEEVYFSRSLMFIALRQNGSLARPGTRRVFLIQPQPQGPPVMDVSIEVRETLKREYLGKKEVPVTRISYLKPPPAMNRDWELLEAYVDKFGRIVEETRRGGVRTVLVKGEEEAVGHETRLRQRARRDPFRKDLAMTLRAKEKEGAEADGRKEDVRISDASQVQARLKEGQKLLEDLKRAREENREAEGEQIYQKLLALHQALRKFLQERPQGQEVQRQAEELRRQSEEVWGGAERLMKKLRLVYVRVMELFDRDECDEMAKGVEELRKAQDRPELQDTPQLLLLAGWVAKVEPLVAKCRTRMELARKKIVLTGTIAYEEWTFQPVDPSVAVFGHVAGAPQEVRFIKPNRLAVINDKVYRVGDVVEGEGVRVEKIWPHGVQVSLREETRDVGIRQ